MLGPSRHQQGRCVGPSFGWMFYCMGIAWVGVAGYELIRPWLGVSLPPLFSHIDGIEMLLGAAAGLSAIVIASAVVSGAAHLFDRLTRAQNENSAATETTAQPSQKTES
jgi:uncharacterized membrane protein (DUF485 family)